MFLSFFRQQFISNPYSTFLFYKKICRESAIRRSEAVCRTRYLIKFVKIRSSRLGGRKPAFSASLKEIIRVAILSASTLIVCKPSASCIASSRVLPCIWFQYWEDASGILFIKKYLFNLSNAALAPPLRQETTHAPTFPSMSLPPAKNKRSRRQQIWPVADP